MKQITVIQQALIFLIFNQEESGIESKGAKEELLKQGMDYDNVIIDNDDEIHYPGYETKPLFG